MTETQLEVTINDVYLPVFDSDADVIDLWGGRGGGRSYFMSQYILIKLTNEEYFRGVLMRSVFNNVRKSLWKELMDRIKEWGLDGNLFQINEALMTCKYIPNGNSVFAHGFKASSKAATGQQKSLAGITHAFIDEADENNYDEYKQLSTTIKRTKKVAKPQIFRAFNPPPKDHWLMQKFYNLKEHPEYEGWFTATPKNIEGFLSVFATYLDNSDNYSETGKRELLAYGNPKDPLYDIDYYCSNVLGLISEGRIGRIFKNWNPITVEEFEKIRTQKDFYVLDFGFSEDPDALARVKMRGDTIWVHELLYQNGLSPEDLHHAILSRGVNPKDMIIHDHEPRLTTALKRDLRVRANDGQVKILKGLRGLRRQKKPPGSLLAGIKLLQTMKVYYTETSMNLINEYLNYTWKVSADKKPMNDPIDEHNHVIDCLRSGVYTLRGRGDKKIKKIR